MFKKKVTEPVADFLPSTHTEERIAFDWFNYWINHREYLLKLIVERAELYEKAKPYLSPEAIKLHGDNLMQFGIDYDKAGIEVEKYSEEYRIICKKGEESK